MFGKIVRSAPVAVIGALVAALLSFVLAPMMKFMGPESGLIHRSFAAIDEHALFIILLSIVLSLIARAALEASPRAVR